MGAFGKYHPAVLFTYFLSVLFIAMFAANPIIQILALSGGALFSIFLHRKKFFSSFTFYILIFLLISFTNPLFSHNGVTPLFFMNGNPITLEAILYGISMAMMIVGVIIWFGCMTAVITSDKMIYLFGRVIPKVSLILSMALRFVPLFLRQWRKTARAQKAMGLNSEGIIDRIKGGLDNFSNVTAWAFEHSIETANAMKARGYGIKGRTSFALFSFKKRDGIFLTVTSLLVFITVLGIVFGKIDFTFYPAVSEIDHSLGSIAVYIAYGVLSYLPFIIEAKEALIWKYCVFKI